MAKPIRKKPSKHLVTIGAHVPAHTKMTLQAMADAQNITMYKLLQDLLEEKAAEFEEEINALKRGESTGEELEDTLVDDGEDLLS